MQNALVNVQHGTALGKSEYFTPQAIVETSQLKVEWIYASTNGVARD